jgi:hypothetical protein
MDTCKPSWLRVAGRIGVLLFGLAGACESNPANVLWGPRALPSVRDAEVEADAALAQPAERLQVSIELQPPITMCGECSNLLASVRGGRPPYSFTWSDSRLVGPGPHRVCPSAPTVYVVVVTAGAVASEGSSLMLPEVATGERGVVCSGPLPDAGARLDAAVLTGAPPASACSNPELLELGNTCQSNALGMATQQFHTLSQPLMAARTYQVSYDVDSIQRAISAGLIADVYGAIDPCQPLDLLGTLRVDADTTHQSFCATARHDYRYIVITSRPEGNLLGLAATAAATICPGCNAD